MISALLLSLLIAQPLTEAERAEHNYYPFWEQHCEWVAKQKVSIADAAARLDSRGEDDRIGAALDMACFGENAKPYIPKMIRTFTSRHGENQSIGQSAVVHLGEIAVPFLIKALDDPDPDIRDHSIWALKFIGLKAKPALAPLKALQGKKGYNPDSLRRAIDAIEGKDIHTFYYPQ